MARIGIIGGSGLYKIEGIKIDKEVEVKTPLGNLQESWLSVTWKVKKLYLCHAMMWATVYLPAT